MNLKNYIKETANFPKQGILFRDFSPLLNNPQACDFMLKAFAEQIDLNNIDAIVGIESRGFILASMMAAKWNKSFIAFRKAGKLPPPCNSISYDLEYGSATIEAQAGKQRVLIVDDVLATGGTLKAAIELANICGHQVQNVAVLINLKDLNQLKFNDKKIISLIEY